MATLTNAIYGKDKVRVFRVVRDGPVHKVVEYNVKALLQGDIATSYTQADNSVIVATDSIKNTTYILAKQSPHILDPTVFALHLGLHFVTLYPHINKANISIEQLKWSRIVLPGKPEGHNHSFVRDGDEKRTVEVVVDATKGKGNVTASVKGGLKDLLVLKSTGSAFEGFIRDEYTTLAEVSDRIFSTDIASSYTFPIIGSEAEPLSINNLTAIGKKYDFESVAKSVRATTLEIFAEDESASVQATLYKTAEKVLASNSDVLDITYALPNKHYIPVNLEFFKGTKNVTPPGVAEVFTPVEAPSGYIEATISRSSA